VRTFVFVVALAGTLLLSVVTDGIAVGVPSASTACRVSRTSSHPVPRRSSFNFGSTRIAVDLPPGARFLAVPDGNPGGAFIQKDGWIRTKLGWYTARGVPHVTGRRVDGTGRRLRADVGPLSGTPDGTTFYPSLLYFPSFGCWRIMATAGRARLEAIVSVQRA
jgi:hypothetical protein